MTKQLLFDSILQKVVSQVAIFLYKKDDLAENTVQLKQRIPAHRNKTLHSNCHYNKRRSCQSRIGKRKAGWKETRENLVAIVLVEQRYREHEYLEENAEAVTDTEADYQNNEGTFESQFGGGKDPDSIEIPYNDHTDSKVKNY